MMTTHTDLPIEGLHHFAYRCRDAEETRVFYEDLLGLPLVHFLTADSVPSTGENHPYAHLFFQMRNGGCIAFFDLGDGQAAEPSRNTAAWVNHIALEMPALADVMRARERLLQAGVAVLGPTDHGFVKSIYFFDPNGLRLELTVRTEPPGFTAHAAATAHAQLRDWTHRRR